MNYRLYLGKKIFRHYEFKLLKEDHALPGGGMACDNIEINKIRTITQKERFVFWLIFFETKLKVFKERKKQSGKLIRGKNSQSSLGGRKEDKHIEKVEQALDEKDIICAARILQSSIFDNTIGTYYGCNFCKYSKGCFEKLKNGKGMHIDILRKKLQVITGVDLSLAYNPDDPEAKFNRVTSNNSEKPLEQ